MKTSDWMITDENILSVICEKYQRNAESLQEDVKTLRDWMKTQHHLPEILDDKTLQNFLTLNKCSIEKAKQKIDMYYTLRSKIPQIFDHVNPRSTMLQECQEILPWVVLPHLTEDKYRVWWIKALDKDSIDKVDPLITMSYSVALREIKLKEDVMFGEIVVMDTDGFPFSFMSKLTLPVIGKMVAVYEKIFSLPMKKLYIINSPAFIGIFVEVLKNVLKPKIFAKITVCRDTSILQEAFPKECIPKDYGGDAKSMRELLEMNKIKMKEYQNRYDELAKFRVDESLRPEKLKNDEILGFHGNFKKLNVD